MEIKLFNTLSREKELFIPIKDSSVGLYTCGPTVYDYDHIGHMRSYIFADIVKRTLLSAGYEVKHVENITDVGHLVGDGDEGEDKMEVGARKAGKSAFLIAKYYSGIFKRNLERVNVLHPDIWAPATDYVLEQINFIKVLEQKGYAYKIKDGLYFDTSKFNDYGKFAKLDVGGLKAGARIEQNKEKKNLGDFALWRFHDGKREMKWESPWGVGIPGWHIECSAISTKFLGERFDIHTGGIDHIPVHHTNEIAQNEARFGHKVVNFWLHNDFVMVNSAKMSKSLGNLYTLDDLEKRGFSPLAYRYLCLGTHYRQKLNFTWEALEGAQNALNKLIRALATPAEIKPSQEKPPLPPAIVPPLVGATARSLEHDFESAIYDDLNTPRTLAVLWESIGNPLLCYKFDKVLGLSLRDQVSQLRESQVNVSAEVRGLIVERQVARLAENWEKADELRSQIEAKGYKVSDGPVGQKLEPLA